MSLYAKIINQTQIETAPRNYKNISNFNLNQELMLKEGFKPVVSFYSKTDKNTHYFYENKVPKDLTPYTTKPCPGSNYEWNEDLDDWELPLDTIKASRAEEIRRAADAEAASYRRGYSVSEQETWAKQEKGAKDLSIDPESTTTEANWVKLLAQTRGLTVTQQVEKILAAVEIANYAAALILGKQQKLEDQIKSATSISEVESITWDSIPTFSA